MRFYHPEALVSPAGSCLFAFEMDTFVENWETLALLDGAHEALTMLRRTLPVDSVLFFACSPSAEKEPDRVDLRGLRPVVDTDEPSLEVLLARYGYPPSSLRTYQFRKAPEAVVPLLDYPSLTSCLQTELTLFRDLRGLRPSKRPSDSDATLSSPGHQGLLCKL